MNGHLEPAGQRAVLTALSGDMIPLSGEVEIITPRQRADLATGAAQVRFGPARVDWRVTGLGVYQGAARLVTIPLATPVRVRRGQSLALTVTSRVELEAIGA